MNRNALAFFLLLLLPHVFTAARADSYPTCTMRYPWGIQADLLWDYDLPPLFLVKSGWA